MKDRPRPPIIAESHYPPGMSGTPNRTIYPAIEPYCQVYQSLIIGISQGRTTRTRSWWCYEHGTYGIYGCGPFKSWQAAMDEACRRARTYTATRKVAA